MSDQKSVSTLGELRSVCHCAMFIKLCQLADLLRAAFPWLLSKGKAGATGIDFMSSTHQKPLVKNV